ncbi:hypothetical protein GCM10008927_17950 [Amylibacter ulvae]|uniref:Methyltransferase domain-containing protein n=1 Tax=Paramylibacter ulvae TaxID=1651968 RepID=A0ABQ3D157_9RHOB|nr:class I SAM-dependent methyltransferase [Amylibacter ulvae]GHA52724.1 hypothetical protein GCM10008927_17950 [Amylibacter ulvae]
MADPYGDTQKLYRRAAAEYDAGRNKSLFEKTVLDALLSRCPDNARILYLGSGAGEPMAAYLIAKGAQITGVDFAAEMVATTQKRFPDHTWIAADMRDFETDQKFDAIISWSGLFHLTRPDQIAMFPKFARWLTPQGAILVATGDQDGEVYGTVADTPVYHSSLAPDHYCQLFTENGFSDIQYTTQDPDCGGFTHWIATLGS